MCKDGILTEDAGRGYNFKITDKGADNVYLYAMKLVLLLSNRGSKLRKEANTYSNIPRDRISSCKIRIGMLFMSRMVSMSLLILLILLYNK